MSGEAVAAMYAAVLAGPIWVSATWAAARHYRRWEVRDEERARNVVAERYSQPPRPVILPEPQVIDLTDAVQRRAADRHLNTPPVERHTNSARHRAAARNGAPR